VKQKHGIMSPEVQQLINELQRLFKEQTQLLDRRFSDAEHSVEQCILDSENRLDSRITDSKSHIDSAITEAEHRQDDCLQTWADLGVFPCIPGNTQLF